MSTGTERPYLSIGEVLELLKEEFPEVSISRIRTLESQGHLQLERTASGYRKFYDADVTHLRTVLRRQSPQEQAAGHATSSRTHLEGGGADVQAEAGDADADASEIHAGELPGQPERRHPASFSGTRRPSTPARSPRSAPAAPSVPVPAAQTAAEIPLTDVAAVHGAEAGASGEGDPPAGEGAPRLALVTAPPPPVAHIATEVAQSDAPAPTQLGSRNPLAANPSGLSLSLDDLCKAAGVTPEQVRELEGFGLLRGHSMFSTVYYDEDALLTCRLVSEFRRFGVEPRHLRMYKLAADREAAFFEQVVTPQLRRRNADAKERAIETLGELVRLGEQLRVVALRQVLRAAVDPN